MEFGSNWKHLTRNFFNQPKDKNVVETPLDPPGQERISPEPIFQYANDTVTALQRCANAMHGYTNPKEISYYVMKTLREYYGADYACVMEVNIDLDYWFLRWASREGYETIEEDDVKKLIRPEEFTHYAKSWIKAFDDAQPVMVKDVEVVKQSNPEEYALYTRLEAKSVMGFPFCKNSKGFVIVRNPTKHFGDIALLQLCAYVLMSELNEYKMIQSLRLQAESFNITDEDEVRLDLFDGVRVTHIGGQYTPENFSPDQRIVLTYMAIYPKTISAREMEREIWEEYEGALQEGQKVRRAINGIVNKCTLLKQPLIFRDDAGYKFNPAMKVVVDVREFRRMFEQSEHVSDLNAQKQLLGDMIRMYKGPIRTEAKSPTWMYQDQHHLESVYLKAVNRLLHIFYNEGDYDALHRYAAKSMEIVPNNLEGYYWKIRAYRMTFHQERANSLLETARKCILDEEYQSLVIRLENRGDPD